MDATSMTISGSRNMTDYEFFCKCMATVEKPTIVYQGECKTGADQFAKQWCKENGVECIPMPADWSKGNSAGPARNEQMIIRSAILVAFPAAVSPGTRNAIKWARTYGRKVHIFNLP